MTVPPDSHSAYKVNDPTAQILAALQNSDLASGSLTYRDLLALDQFHIGGAEQTRLMASAADLEKGDRVLDIGAAIGGAARVLAAEYRAKVTAIDQSEEYITTARTLNDMVGLAENIQCKVQSAPGMTFEDESFDIIWLQLVLMNVESKQALYSEVYRLLRPGGRIAIFDVVASKPNLDIEYPVIWADNPSQSHLITIEEHRALLAAAGFTDPIVTDYSEQALAWYAAMQNARSGSRSTLQVGLLIPGNAGLKSRNVQAAVRNEQIRPMQLIAGKLR